MSYLKSDIFGTRQAADSKLPEGEPPRPERSDISPVLGLHALWKKLVRLWVAALFHSVAFSLLSTLKSVMSVA
jgi:hypothetical protein